MIAQSSSRVARPMRLSETGLVIDYFQDASPETLNAQGVDPSRIPPRAQWKARIEHLFGLPLEQRHTFLVIWEENGQPVGFSSADKIRFGEDAYMHLHIVQPERRQQGHGAFFVKQTAQIYFEMLQIQRLFCEPYAFNVAPNRTLQRAGFKYIKTHETVPGWMNFHQPVTRWMLEKDQVQPA